jgi:hypothetical protein
MSWSMPFSPNTVITALIICTVISACVSGKRACPAPVSRHICVGLPRPAGRLSASTSPSDCSLTICWRTASTVTSSTLAMSGMPSAPRVFSVDRMRSAGWCGIQVGLASRGRVVILFLFQRNYFDY